MNDRGQRICILAIGQSNIANHGAGREASAFGRVLFDGAFHPVADPIPGGSGELGSVWPRLAELFRMSRRIADLTICLAAKGGTSIADWSDGPCRSILETRLADMRAIGLVPSHVIFHQGERDTHLGTGMETYLESFGLMHQSVSATYPGVRWIVCRASYRFGLVSEAVRAAQNRIPETYCDCRPGPDTDTLGDQFRHDSTHFNARGLATFASMLADAILSPEDAEALAEATRSNHRE